MHNILFFIKIVWIRNCLYQGLIRFKMCSEWPRFHLFIVWFLCNRETYWYLIYLRKINDYGKVERSSLLYLYRCYELMNFHCSVVSSSLLSYFDWFTSVGVHDMEQVRSLIFSFFFYYCVICLMQISKVPLLCKKIVAAFRGMHVSPAKHSYASVTDGRTDRQTDGRRTKWSLCVAICFADDTKTS